MSTPSLMVRRLLGEASEDELKDILLQPDRAEPLEGLPVGNEYERLARRLEGRRGNQLKVNRNTWLCREADGRIILRLHQTNIITWFPDNSVIVDADGFHTKTTFQRLSDFLPIGGWNLLGRWPPGQKSYVSWQQGRQERTGETSIGNWFWYNRVMDDKRLMSMHHRDQPFTDGDKIDANGTLHPQAAPELRRRGKYLRPPAETPPAAPPGAEPPLP